MVQAGDQWLEEIKKALAATKVTVLLVSRHFFDSEFILSREVPPILNATKVSGMRLMWLPISFTSFDRTFLTRYQALQDPQKPLDSLPKYEVDQVLVKVCEQISRAASA